MKGVKPDEIDDVMIASVVPTVMHSLTNGVKRYLDCFAYGCRTRDKNRNEYQNGQSHELGADRIVNAVAAIHKYKPPLVIVDFGTATTFCAVDRNGNYVGGVIAAGIKIQWTRFLKKPLSFLR